MAIPNEGQQVIRTEKIYQIFDNFIELCHQQFTFITAGHGLFMPSYPSLWTDVSY